jgi:hypothetical protein
MWVLALHFLDAIIIAFFMEVGVEVHGNGSGAIFFFENSTHNVLVHQCVKTYDVLYPLH